MGRDHLHHLCSENTTTVIAFPLPEIARIPISLHSSVLSGLYFSGQACRSDWPSFPLPQKPKICQPHQKRWGWGANNTSAISHLPGPAPLMLVVEHDCFFSVHPQLGGSGGFLCTEAPNASSDTQSSGQVGPWEEETGRGSCKALTQPSSPSKGPHRHPASPLPRGTRTGLPLPAPCHHPATTRLCHWGTRLCQNSYFGLLPPVDAAKITSALSASLQMFQGQIQSSSLSLSKSLLIPAGLGHARRKGVTP